jgi:hypothetical protein
MALKRIITEKVALERTYEKFRRDFDLLPTSHADNEKVKAALEATKTKMVNLKSDS